MLDEPAYIYDDGTHTAEVGQLQAFFLGLQVECQVINVAEDEAARRATADWTEQASEAFPIVRIGEKIRALFFRAKPDTLAPAYAPGVGTPLTSQPVTVYSATWCPDCRRLEGYLDAIGAAYEKIDIENTAGAPEQIIRWSGGRRVVPTVRIGDAALLFNPGPQTLGRLLGF
ncbi:MAG: hypothetical protein NZ585_03585 [Chloracidobacterium sp.]|nr:hypothetical protein [Chloracidobacterium sp.]MDW8217174.1 glutaredoxin domain-containing protein [Acidobacteriota bacterium]